MRGQTQLRTQAASKEKNVWRYEHYKGLKAAYCHFTPAGVSPVTAAVMNNRDSLRERHTSIHSNDQLSTLTSSNLLVCLFTSPPDGPQRPSVSVSPSAEMLEGGSVTLTCSTDANPAASYTWYKEDGTSDPHLLSKEPQLVFSSIQSSDSGRYSCTAENQLGRKTSDFISIDVKCE